MLQVGLLTLKGLSPYNRLHAVGAQVHETDNLHRQNSIAFDWIVKLSSNPCKFFANLTYDATEVIKDPLHE